MADMAIQTEHLTRDFATVRAVDDLSLEVPQGIIFGFLGPNGSGKTTTIRLLLGLIAPTQGSAHVLGWDLRAQADAIRERTGVLLEHHGLYERLTAEDNLDFYARIARLSPGERKARIQELLTHFELWDRRKESVGTWSRGMKQKLAIARAILARPALVFLDEPTAGLDPVASAALRDDIARMAEREGVTIFITTHNLSEAERLCHQVGVIRRGRLLAAGEPGALRNQTGGTRVEFRGAGFDGRMLALLRARPEVADVEAQDGRLTVQLAAETRVAPLVRLLVEAGAEIDQVLKGTPSLEEVFMTLMEEDDAR